MRVWTVFAKNLAPLFDSLLDGPTAAFLHKRAERGSIVSKWVRLSTENLPTCNDPEARGSFESVPFRADFESCPDPVKRPMWTFSNERQAMSWAQDLGLMLEPTAKGVQ